MSRAPPLGESDMTKKAAKTLRVSQRERFIQMAHELGTDEDEETFKEKLTKIAKEKSKKLIEK